MQEYSLRLKKLISHAQEDSMLKIERPVYKRLVKSNRVYVPTKNRCKSNLSTVNVNRSLHQDLMHNGCRGTTVPNVCLQALTLSLPSPRDFFTLSPNSLIKCFTFLGVYMNPGLIHASAIILFSLCSELVTCTSFVREYAKN